MIPVFLGIGFMLLGMVPTLGLLIVVQILRRAGNYAIMRPAREMLYVVLGKEEKYKAKNFIDTVVYRGGDAVSAWAYSGLKAAGLSLSALAWIAVPLAGIWAWISFRLGKRQAQLAILTSSRIRRANTPPSESMAMRWGIAVTATAMFATSHIRSTSATPATTTPGRK